MDKKSIIILVIITAIISALVISLKQEHSGISSIYLSSDVDIEVDASINQKREFDRNEKNIFLIIKTKNLNTYDNIRVLFKIKENDIYQENILFPEIEGSSIITITLLKKNDLLEPGDYFVQVFLNEKLVKTDNFLIY